ncbi:sulfur carrier protein ThiS [Candidatus Soleaferrea massiliensis]|uniref:sulfur carrier protein ThiS n=1 Tax=Candidatus Soleaferrea massiliensis TaxID=1470354 RepID=UPI00058E0FB6|nr:sulfur carrier protein ThiS [Candidatus Soleaferrea massiliensis]
MIVNGKEWKLAQPCSLEVFLREQGYQLSCVAVELSGHIVPKAAYAQTMLRDADRLEIVGFVGGG